MTTIQAQMIAPGQAMITPKLGWRVVRSVESVTSEGRDLVCVHVATTPDEADDMVAIFEPNATVAVDRVDERAAVEWALTIVNEQMHARAPGNDIRRGLATAVEVLRDKLTTMNEEAQR